MQRSVRIGTRQMPYELRQTDRRSMEMRVDADGTVRVFAPKRSRMADVDAFVRARADWCDEAAARLRAVRARHEAAHPATDGADVLYEGRPLRLHVVAAPKASAHIEGDLLIVETPDPSPDAVRATARAFLTERARAAVAGALSRYAPRVGRTPRTVAIRDQRTRWGSCSNLGGHNYNWKLIMAPREALDYVVVHELCHLYELNHSKRFWALVEAVMPDYEDWKRWLKDNGDVLGL